MKVWLRSVYLEKKRCSGTKIWVKYDILALQANSTPAQIEVKSYSKNGIMAILPCNICLRGKCSPKFLIPGLYFAWKRPEIRFLRDFYLNLCWCGVSRQSQNMALSPIVSFLNIVIFVKYMYLNQIFTQIYHLFALFCLKTTRNSLIYVIFTSIWAGVELAARAKISSFTHIFIPEHRFFAKYTFSTKYSPRFVVFRSLFCLETTRSSLFTWFLPQPGLM